VCTDAVGSPEAVQPGDPRVSVGSRNHEVGRCKPCVFFHTKGCTSGRECLFCHLCPAHEKQRRKRLRRQMCRDLISSYEKQPQEPHAKLQGSGKHIQALKPRSQVVGHARQNSDASTTCTGPPSPEGRGGRHSRQWSQSTQESAGASPSPTSASNACSLSLPQASASSTPSQAGSTVGLPPTQATQDLSMYVYSPPAHQQQTMSTPMGVFQPFVFLLPASPVAAQPQDASARWRENAMADHDDSWEPVPEPAAEEAAHSIWGRSGRHASMRGTTGAAHPQRDMAPAQMPVTQGQQHQAVQAAGYVTCNGMQYALVPIAGQPYPACGDYAAQPPPAMPAATQAEPAYGHWQPQAV